LTAQLPLSSYEEEAVVGKVWILDTETKGTGANMVPLDSVLRKGSDTVPGFNFPKLKPPGPGEPEPQAPRRFRVVDVQTREVLAEDADARTTIAALEPVRSIVDVNVWVWQPERERWRMLSMDELRALWGYRGQLAERAARPKASSVRPAESII
jgi:hypothetical protein